MYTHFKKLLGGSLVVMALFLGGCPLGFCGAGPDESQTEISLYVTDSATGTPVPNPTFLEGGTALSSSCQQMDPDSGLCASELLLVDPGVHSITVTADGYAPQSLTVDTSSIESAHVAVEMQANSTSHQRPGGTQ